MNFNTVDLEELVVILICGMGLVTAIIYSSSDLAMAMGGGLVGYLGGFRMQMKG